MSCFSSVQASISFSESMDESIAQDEGNRTIVLGVTKNKKSKKKKKQASTFRYTRINYSLLFIYKYLFSLYV